MNWLSLIPVLMSAASTIKSLNDISNSNTDLVDKLKQGLPTLGTALEAIGGALFPKVAPQLKMAAGAMASFDPNVTKWLQGSLNSLLDPSPELAVDGIYGRLTKAAVERLQEKMGLTVDGWAGALTQAAISNALSK